MINYLLRFDDLDQPWSRHVIFAAVNQIGVITVFDARSRVIPKIIDHGLSVVLGSHRKFDWRQRKTQFVFIERRSNVGTPIHWPFSRT